MSLHLLEARAYTYGALDYNCWKKVAVPFREISFILQNDRIITKMTHAKDHGANIPTCDLILKDRTEPLVIDLSFAEACSLLDSYVFRQTKPT